MDETITDLPAAAVVQQQSKKQREIHPDLYIQKYKHLIKKSKSEIDLIEFQLANNYNSLKVDLNKTDKTQKRKFSQIQTSIDTKKETPITIVKQEKGIEKNIIKKELTGHSLAVINRPRVKGFCVECIKKKGEKDQDYKKTMTKITTYCPGCPGGNWICELCFMQTHYNQD